MSDEQNFRDLWIELNRLKDEVNMIEQTCIKIDDTLSQLSKAEQNRADSEIKRADEFRSLGFKVLGSVIAAGIIGVFIIFVFWIQNS